MEHEFYVRKTVDLMHQVHWTGYGEQGRYRQKGLQFHLTVSSGSGIHCWVMPEMLTFDREYVLRPGLSVRVIF
jgi:hypothetical protein